MPQLVALHKKNEDKGLMVVGLHCQEATDDEIKDVVKKLKVKFPVTKGGGGPSKGNGIPHSLVFAPSGKLVFEGHPAAPEFDKAVKKALKEVTANATPASGLGPKPGTSPAPSAPSATKPAAATKGAALVPERAWTNTDGKVMMAALISVDGDSARFKKKDGTTFSYSISKLIEDDQTAIKEAAEKAKETP
jgi:hypothetical protein